MSSPRCWAASSIILDDCDLGKETASEGRFGYASRHLQVSDETGAVAQVQVRTALQHAWAESEHGIRYKGSAARARRDFDRRFTLAAGPRAADQEFTTIRKPAARWPAGGARTWSGDAGITHGELAADLAGQFLDAEWSRADHYAWIGAGRRPRHHVSAGLGEALAAVDTCTPPPGRTIVTRLAPSTARRRAAARFRTAYIDLTGNAHRRPALTARLERMLGTRRDESSTG